MEQFPELKDGQVALLMADVQTGSVLDKSYDFVLNNEQKVYRIFDNSNDALKFAKSIMQERKNIECVIYGTGQEMLFYLTPENIHSY